MPISQQSRFLALVSNSDLLKQTLETANNAEGAGTIQALKTMDNLETKLQQLQTAYQQFYTSLGAEELWKGTLTGLTSYIEQLNDMPKLFGKIPIAAINIIVPAIKTLKNLLLSLLEQIAKKYQTWLHELPTQGASEAAEQSEKTGKNIVGRLVEGMRSAKSQVEKERDAILAAAGMQTEKTQTQTKKVSSAFTFLQESLSYRGGAAAGEEAYLMAAYNELNSVGLIQGLNPAKMSTEELRVALQNVIDTYNQTSAAAQQAGRQGQQAALATANGFQAAKAKLQAFGNVWKDISTARNIVSTLGLSLQTLAANLDQSTEGAANFSAVLQGFAGVMTAFSYSNPILAALSAILAVGTAAYQIFKNKSLEKQIERATEKAKELNEEALFAKDEYKSLDSGIEKYEQLKEKRYESAEAAEEYQEQVDSLAESYPELIKGFDAAGNAILDASAQERLLAKLREKTAAATADAAEAERKEALLKLKEKQEATQEAAKKLVSSNDDDLWNMSAFNVFKSLIDHSFIVEGGTLTKDAVSTKYNLLNGTKDEKSNSTQAFLLSLLSTMAEGTTLEYSGQQDENGTRNNNYIGTITAKNEEGEELYSINYDLLKQSTDSFFAAIKRGENSLDALDTLEKNLQDAITSETLRNAYLTLLQSQEEYSDFFSALLEEQQQKLVLDSTKKEEASAILSLKLGTVNGYESVLDNSSLFTIFSNAVSQGFLNNPDYENLGFEDYLAAEYSENTVEELYKEYDDFYNLLTTSRRELFEEMFSSDNISFENMAETFGIESESELYRGLESWYGETIENWSSLIESRLLKNGKNKNVEIKTQSRFDAYSAALEDYESLLERGYESRAKKYLEQFEELYKQIETADNLSAAEKDSIFTLLQGADLSSYSGYYELKKQLEDYYEEIGENLPEELVEYLNNMRDSLVNNLSLSFATLTDSVVSKIEEITEAIDGATEALDFTDAFSLYQKLIAAEGNEVYTFDSLFEMDITDPTKYILKETEALKNWREYQYKSLKEEAEYLEEQVKEAETLLQITKLKGMFSQNNIQYALQHFGSSTSFSNSNDFWEAVKNNPWLMEGTDGLPEGYSNVDLISTIEELSLQDDFYDYYKGIIDFTELEKRINSAVADNTESANLLKEAARQNESIQPISDAIDLGQYAEAIELINSTFAGDEALKTKWLNYVHTQAQNAYSSMIEDFAKGGAELVKKNAATYGADFEGLAENFTYKDARAELIKRYASGEYSQKEYNEQRATLDEAQRNINNALTDSFSSIITNASSITEEDIADFANALGKGYGLLALKFTENEDGTFSASLDAIRQFIAESYGEDIPTAVEDALRKYLSSVVKYFENGINGKASLEDIANLKTAFGIEDIDYTETLDGLQFTRGSIYEILAKVREQDALTFNAMVESYAEELADIDEGYNDIYSVMQKIEDIEKEIKSGKVNNERLKVLNAELAVAKEIEQTLKEADDTFNFMDRDLPSGFDDPISAWEGVGDAMKVLNGDNWADGLVDFQDFYNMIDFIGDDLITTALGFKQDAFTAADLIQAAADATKMVDGEMFVDWQALGDQFNISADGMKEGITDGIHKVAESQIEMLDAAIGVLETIVAMEKIGDVAGEDATLDLSEAFVIDDFGNVTDITEKWSETLEAIEELLGPKGADVLEKIYYEEKSLKEILDLNIEEIEKVFGSYENYLDFFTKLYNASQSSEYDSNNWNTIFESLGLDKEITFQSGEKTITFNPDGTRIEYQTGEITSTYTATDGSTHKISNDNSEEDILNIEEQIAFDKAVGDYDIEIDSGSIITFKNEEGIEYKYFLTDEGTTAYYNGKEYQGTNKENILEQIQEDIQAQERFDGAQFQETGTTVKVGEKIYTEIQLSTGETVWTTEDGTEILTKDSMTDLLTQELASLNGGEVTTVPIDASLEISTVKEVSFSNEALPEEGITYEGSVRIIPTSIEIEATEYKVDFLDKNNQVSQTISITGEAQLAAVIAGAKITDGEWVLPDMTADLNLSISEESQEKIKVFFDELIEKLQNIQVSFSPSGTISSETNKSSKVNNINTNTSFDNSNLSNVFSSINTTVSTFVSNIQTYLNNLKAADSELAKQNNGAKVLKEASTALKTLPSNGATKIDNVRTAINKLPSNKTVAITLKVNVANSNATVTVSSTSSGTINKSSNSPEVKAVESKGNVALSKGTLMGELGPELVVSGGRYFTVGNSGPEFVNLADDAIVFNHLQTKKLLSSGSASTYGTPVTNEKKATAFASGNAMASAAETLAELKQIRAMWQSLLDATASDLGAKAGSGSGSSGGGGTDDEGGYTYDLERWYNLLRQIEKLEAQITYEQAKRENMVSGYSYVDSLEKELDLLEKQLEVEKELASLQYDYYLKRMEDVNKSVYGKIFTYDEQGLMQFVDGENRGLDALAKLQATDENGVLLMDSAEQLKYITNTLGISLNDLKYKDDGTEAESDADKVKVFFDNVDSIMKELDELYDSYHEHAEKIEELTNSQNEILQEYVDNQRSLEDKLLQAIEDREQAIIDQMTDEREALEESSQDYINGLSDALTKEKNLYNQNQTDEETAKLQRRLAILQRSGGSTSEIKSLQNQIDSRLQDAYFQAQQDQIDAIQEASNNQLEKLQTQIDLMTETLEYQKENGLLWNEVYEMMNQWTPERMLQFIEQYTKSYQEGSSLENAESSKETLKEAEIWAAKQDYDIRDAAWESYYASINYDDSIKSTNSLAAKEAFNEAYQTGGQEAAEAAANQVFENAKKRQDELGSNASVNGSFSSSSSSGDLDEEAGDWYGRVQTNTGKGLYIRKAASLNAEILGKIPNGEQVKVYGVYDGGNWYRVKYNGIKGYAYKDYIKKYASGGLVDFTGPAWVDGSKSHPEAFLSAEDTALLKNNVFGSNGSLASIVAAIEEITKGSSNYVSSGSGITIENATVNIQPGVISNDYDARRAGEMALEEMVKIARKTTNRIVSR